MDNWCRSLLREQAARTRRLEVLCKVDVPCSIRGIIVWRVHAIVVGRAVPDNIQFARSTSNAPRHNGGSGWALVDLCWNRPARSLIRGEAVVEVVIITEYKIDISCHVDTDVNELVPVTHGSVRVDIHWMVGEGRAAVGGYCKPDRVQAAVATCRLGRAGDSA